MSGSPSTMSMNEANAESGSAKAPPNTDDAELTDTLSATSRLGAGAAARTTAGIIALGSLAVLVVAAGLDPSPTGIGTHMQLGFAPCRWITYLDIPCPTCGMTTAFANATHGHLLDGFLSQPFGFVLALATSIAFWLGAYVAITGSMVYKSVTALWRPAFIWSLAVLAFLAWLFKIWIHTNGGELWL